MKIKTLALAVVVSIAMTGTANAAITFKLNGIRFSDGATVSGSFTTNEALDEITDWSITTDSSVNGVYAKVTYSPDYVTPLINNASFYPADFNEDGVLDSGLVFTQPGAALYVIMNGELTAKGGKILTVSESTMVSVASRNSLSGIGSIDAIPADFASPLPESSTWAMMLVGFGLIGATTRYRRRSAKVTYA